MIYWGRVLKVLQPHCLREVESIEEALFHLYEERNFSLAIIANLTNREVISPQTIRAKLKKYSIPIRGRGGVNYFKDFPLTLKEVELNSVALLAKKYNVHVTTIYNRIKQLEKEEDYDS